MIESDNFRLASGWLSPDGLWYSCKSCNHIDIAEAISEKYNYNDDDYDDDNYCGLETNGWVRMTYTGMSLMRPCSFIIILKRGKKLTMDQRRKLIDWWNYVNPSRVLLGNDQIEIEELQD
jgi:hypothetical protein